MNIFNIFKPKNNVYVSAKEQLNTLSYLGITPKHDGYIDWIYHEWGKEMVESDPYNLILFSLGGERENGDAWEPLSDDIYSFDTECIDDDDIYEKIIKRFVMLSKGILNISNVHSSVSHDTQSASISFSYNGADFKWQLKYNDDWFDFDVINKINLLLKENNSSKFFYTCSPDQNVFVIFSSGDIVEKLNRLVTVPFIIDKCIKTHTNN